MTPTLFAIAIFVLLSATAYGMLVSITSPIHIQERRRLAQVAKPSSVRRQRRTHRTDLAPWFTILLRALNLHERIQWDLLRAGLLLKPSEFTVISLAAGGVVLAMSVLITNVLAVQLTLSILGMTAPWFYVMMRKARRAKQITTQLPEALPLIASSLRSGFSILRAIKVAGDQMSPPISQEFGWVLDEVNVGISMQQAFGHMAQRTQSSDVKLMVTAVQIQSKVGGNLAEILETTGAMIRERFQLAAEIAALTSEGRLSAGVLAGLPIGLAVMINLLNPDYLRPLITEPLGIAMLVGGVTLMLLGLIVIKFLLSVDI